MLLNDELRIKQPFVRKGWLENNCKADGKRGRDDFIPISWDEAFELASKELLETKRDFWKFSHFCRLIRMGKCWTIPSCQEPSQSFF